MTRLPLEVGQLWEGRTRFRDGSRERVQVVAITGRQATVVTTSPGPRHGMRRTVAILTEEICGAASVGNMRLVQLADGRGVTWAPGGGQIEGTAC